MTRRATSRRKAADAGGTAHYRTPPGQPQEHVCDLFERVTPEGKRHFYGFVAGIKLLLFPTSEKSASGHPKWRLMSQTLASDQGEVRDRQPGPAETAATPAGRPPLRPYVADPVAPERLPFVSGLPAAFLRRGR